MSELQNILLVDDEERICQDFAEIIRRHTDYAVEWITDDTAINRTLDSSTFNLILLDLQFGSNPLKGMEILRSIRSRPDCPPVIILTASSDTRHAVEAIKTGAIDFLRKDEGLDRLIVTINNGMELARLRQAAKSEYRIIGRHPSMVGLVEEIRKVAQANDPVLVTGETGTGKELVARAIHSESCRVSHPFKPLDVIAVPDGLIESELFGHVKGSFANAYSDREGLLRSAGEGVAFLDEIGDTSLESQAKLRRVLESGMVKPVGGDKEIPYKARIVAATNRDLDKMVEDGKFRDDLLYRFPLRIHIPPLKERREDIPLLFKHLLANEFVHMGKEPPLIDDSVAELLRSPDFTWPSNVRGLQRAAKMIAISHRGGILTAEDLPVEEFGAAKMETDTTGNLVETREQAAKVRLEDSLRRHNGNVEAVAEDLGCSKWNVYRLMKKYGISAKDYASAPAK